MALFIFLKIDQKGTPFWLFSKKINFVKCYIWGMIYIGNLILRTMVFKEFNNSLYFKRYGHLFYINRIFYHGTKTVQN